MMIDAYERGLPDNGKPIPDASYSASKWGIISLLSGSPLVAASQVATSDSPSTMPAMATIDDRLSRTTWKCPK
jgi:hypothetical protein